ncbi:MAG: ComF family protein [Firmicutes bacterium]|nr:ComF family protein [Bacillota bacterium]
MPWFNAGHQTDRRSRLRQPPGSALKAAMNAVFNVFLPGVETCPLCDRPIRPNRIGACGACVGRIAFVTAPICGKCGKPVRGCEPGTSAPGRGRLCGDCKTRPHFFSVTRAVGIYDGGLREYVHALKYGGKPQAARPLGRLMASLAMAHVNLRGCDGLVAVPLHRDRLELRGYNQAELLARNAAPGLGLPYIHGVMARTRPTQSQTSLSPSTRARNLRNAFKVLDPRPVSGRRLLLVDDVYTTGITVDEAARVLLRSGAVEVAVVCLAVGVTDRDLRE